MLFKDLSRDEIKSRTKTVVNSEGVSVVHLENHGNDPQEWSNQDLNAVMKSCYDYNKDRENY